MTGWWATLTDAERAAVRLMLAPDEMFMHRNVGQSQLSVLRHWLGGNVNGREYVYLPPHDELVRKDVLALVQSMRKAQDKARRDEAQAAAKAAQESLL